MPDKKDQVSPSPASRRSGRKQLVAIVAALLAIAVFGSAVGTSFLSRLETVWLLAGFALIILPGVIIPVLLSRREQPAGFLDLQADQRDDTDRHAEARRLLLLGCAFVPSGTLILAWASIVIHVQWPTIAWLTVGAIVAAINTLAVLVWEFRARLRTN